MKGVAKIKGPKNPKIGEDSFYEVVEFHKGTVVPNPNTIKWKIFKKNFGKWEEAKGNSKTGMRVSFKFSPRSYGKELLVEAYLFEPEMKAPPGLVVKPVLGARKIVNTEILDANGDAITKTPKYGQSITLKVTTQNMPGEILTLSLWERDTFKDSGHDASSNTKLWSGQSKTIDIKGIVEQKIQLTLAMQKEANKGVFDGSEHEFYLLVEATGMKTISATTAVSNTVVKPATPIVKQAPVKIKNDVGFDKIKVDDTNKVVKVVVLDEKKEEKKEKKECTTCEEKFKKVAPIILRHEGGYINDPDDSGGETNKGITIGTWKKFAQEDLNIEPTSTNLKNITDEQATIIYRKRYWEPKGFCKIKDDRISLMVYDWTITSGGAAKEVQKLLVNEFGQKIAIDGGIGTATINALNNAITQDKLLERLGQIRKNYYTNLAIKNGEHTKNYKFLNGWLNRVDDCLK